MRWAILALFIAGCHQAPGTVSQEPDQRLIRIEAYLESLIRDRDDQILKDRCYDDCHALYKRPDNVGWAEFNASPEGQKKESCIESCHQKPGQPGGC